jgi:flagellar biosynthetic protein FliQ
MGEGEIGALLRAAVIVVLKLGGPPLLAALAVGLVMSLVQAVTQVQEQIVAFVPKLLAVVGTLLVFGPFMLGTLADFTRLLFDRLIAAGGQ